MAQAPRRPPTVPAATRAAFNRFTGLQVVTVGALGAVIYFLGSKPSNDNSQTGVSNLTLIVGSIAVVAVAYFFSRKSTA